MVLTSAHYITLLYITNLNINNINVNTHSKAKRMLTDKHSLLTLTESGFSVLLEIIWGKREGASMKCLLKHFPDSHVHLLIFHFTEDKKKTSPVGVFLNDA